MSEPRKIAVLGDIHGNLSALEAVMSLIELEEIDEMYCVGDVVGYGPRPGDAIDILVDRGVKCVAGNHDWALLGKIDASYFNPYALAALQWTRKKLKKHHLEWLEGLPLRLDDPGFSLFHGALPDPGSFNYLQSFPAARASLADFEARIGFCGHTHVPMNFIQRPGMKELEWHFKEDWTLGEDERAVVNVGSPGQPRDENPQAPVVFYNVHSGRVRLIRTPYNIAAEQKLIRKAGLPPILGDRLKHGI
ncbi:MAG: metallophosphoesterase [Planctomycetota bacterium]|jgi:diadenosine tetraphosphatase ApaH/serine/threonine PP2A family protein phosphatase|nr:metallophosphoesterase [Planctomycetota bacterium]MDP6940947.1 metallophosphoesterase [Planctomycetota bacterium]